MKIACLGAGMIGRTIAQDLAKNHEVTVFDNNLNSLEILAKAGFTTIKADLYSFDEYDELLRGFSLVTCALPGFMGYRALEAIIRAEKNVVDISFSPENLLNLDALAKEKNVTAIVDCGVAPGLSNLVLGFYNSRMTLDSFVCQVGGLPKNPVAPWKYKASFSPIDVIEEYTRPARIKINGEVVELPAMSGLTTEHFEKVGELDSFNTDGLRSILITMPHIPTLVEKTLRYPGHIQLFQTLQSAGFLSEEKISVTGAHISMKDAFLAMLFEQWKLKAGEPEFTLMKMDIEGTENGKTVKVSKLLYDETDAATGTSSMARTTAFTCTAATNLLADGIFNKTGVFPPELIGGDEQVYNYVMEYLKKRNVVIEEI